MPRKKTKSLKRDVQPDRKHNSVMVQKLINKFMLGGKKQRAESIVYEAMEKATKSLKQEDQLEVLKQAIKNISPAVEVKSRRVGGANYQIPFEVQGDRQQHLALMWFVTACRERRSTMGKPMADVLASEIMDAYNETGMTHKKKEDTHKMADANRAFAHFAKF